MVDQGLQQTYPAVQIWSVGGGSPRVEAVSGAPDTVVSGGPESLLPTADSLTSQPTVLAGQSDGAARSGVLDRRYAAARDQPGRIVGPAVRHADCGRPTGS